eukprot:CAMPEP_0177514704 /NCGR_PEP_ID=MMETSP0369-20130122/44462_1 /TAXON_ID=447022 ORGANISM="Scrippsiella hangoei-like, Strain SHHI-4" /NCGR_SAMPLE_ID=MMETSP0369 /ASSEMBLY_ACC=CAM_ASM_000364 /LENGTH=86 /DNA_ID=CAMNT_0018993419 /DNA_START=251 /DNA_END=508 /DNA_ORIENTATION=-
MQSERQPSKHLSPKEPHQVKQPEASSLYSAKLSTFFGMCFPVLHKVASWLLLAPTKAWGAEAGSTFRLLAGAEANARAKSAKRIIL